MVDEQKTEAPQEGQAPQEPQAPQAEADKQPEQPTGQQEKSTLPDKFKGKSIEEIAQSYTELEKKLGEGAKTVEEKRKLESEVEQWRQLGGFIQRNPALYKALEEEIKSGEQQSQENKETKRDDTRIALEQRIIGDFEKKYAIDSLSDESRSDLHKRIATELAEMLDPGGNKNYQQIVEELPLNKLDTYLNKAYKLATVDDTAERARLQGLLEARQNREATFGSFPASSSNSEIQLTPEQRETARRMKISEKDYAENLKAIEEGR